MATERAIQRMKYRGGPLKGERVGHRSDTRIWIFTGETDDTGNAIVTTKSEYPSEPDIVDTFPLDELYNPDDQLAIYDQITAEENRKFGAN